MEGSTEQQFIECCGRGDLAAVQRLMGHLEVGDVPHHPHHHPQDLDVKEKGEGNTGLMLAAREGHLEVVSCLLLHSVNVNCANRSAFY